MTENLKRNSKNQQVKDFQYCFNALNNFLFIFLLQKYHSSVFLFFLARTSKNWHLPFNYMWALCQAACTKLPCMCCTMRHWETLQLPGAPGSSYSSTYSPFTIFSPCAKIGLEQKSQLLAVLFSLEKKVGSVGERSWSIFLPHPSLDREELGCANPGGLLWSGLWRLTSLQVD